MLKKQDKTRICVYRTSKHIYAQIISGEDSKVLVSASTVEKLIRKKLEYCGNILASELVGENLANRALKKNIKVVSFDRSGYKYHGRIKALAESARKNGLKF